MATLADLAWDTLELLYGIPQFERPVEDTLVQYPGNTTGTEWEFGTPDLWKRGDYAEIVSADRADPSTSAEFMLLTEDHPAALSTVTVRRRAFFDGQPEIGLNAGHVRKNPLFPLHGVYQTVQEVLDSELWPHVWTSQTRKLTNVTPSTDALYDLSAGDEDVVRVYQYNRNATSRVEDLPFGYWDYEPSLHTDAASVPALVVRKVLDEGQPLYVVTRNRPSTSRVANVSTQIETMIPKAVAAKMMLGRVSGVDYDPSRQERDVYNNRSYAQDHYRTFMADFLRLRDAEHARLLGEQPKAPKKYRGNPLRLRRLTG